MSETSDPATPDSEKTNERLNEGLKREIALSQTSMRNILHHRCTPVRLSYQCPNNKLCRDLFPVSLLMKIVHDKRSAIWGTTGDSVSDRKGRLLQELKRLLVRDPEGGDKVVYRLNDKKVCKCFHKVSP